MVNPVRKAIESRYNGICSVYVQTKAQDVLTRQTAFTTVLAYENIACRLSYTRKTAADEGVGATNVSQSIKLFIAPEIDIKAGAIIDVTQNNVTRRYKASGTPAVYSNHQEIELELGSEFA